MLYWWVENSGLQKLLSYLWKSSADALWKKRESETGERRQQGEKEVGRKEGRRENQRTNFKGKKSKETKRNSSHFFYATGHLNKNINLGAVGLKDKIMRLKVKGIEDLKETNWGPKPHHYRANTKIRARNRYIPLKINYFIMRRLWDNHSKCRLNSYIWNKCKEATDFFLKPNR